ncbi:MAG: hypothetical protein RLZZ337_1235 [Bacteroidota bacterium]|jgi:uncharacterized protein YdeI (YjbR/CyaY-like superfamily)
MNPAIDQFIAKQKQWKDELAALRQIVVDCGLNEELKWRQPCYSYNGTNLIILGGFKDFCVISFFKGVLLNDEHGILKKQGENTQSARVIPFTNVQQIIELEPIIKSYIYESIEAEKLGLKVEFTDNKNINLVEELVGVLNQNPSLKQAFEALTPGRKRAYNMFFEAAKQSKTRLARIEKYIPRIMQGKGMNDCVCGLSKRMPNCDGSHKSLGLTV